MAPCRSGCSAPNTNGFYPGRAWFKSGMLCQEQVSWTETSNYIPDNVGCNYLSLPLILATGTMLPNHQPVHIRLCWTNHPAMPYSDVVRRFLYICMGSSSSDISNTDYRVLKQSACVKERYDLNICVCRGFGDRYYINHPVGSLLIIVFSNQNHVWSTLSEWSVGCFFMIAIILLVVQHWNYYRYG